MEKFNYCTSGAIIQSVNYSGDIKDVISLTRGTAEGLIIVTPESAVCSQKGAENSTLSR